MQNKSFGWFNSFSFLVRRLNAPCDVPKSRRLDFERLEDRALLSLSTIPYGPFYEPYAVLKSTENETTLNASETPDDPRSDLKLDVKTSTYDDGRVLCLQLNASKPISAWQIDWGDGTEPSVYERLGDSALAVHTYEQQATNQEYVVVATLTEPDGYVYDEGYCVAFHTTPAKTSSAGTKTTEGTTTTFVTNTFCDAEKSSSSNSNLCWAAGSSNALYYAGWATSEPLNDASGKSETFESEDDVFSYFVENFENSGSSTLYALKWFISGEYDGDDVSGWAQRTENSGGFYSDVDVHDAVEYYSYRSSRSPETIIQDATEELEQGWAVCASLGYYSSSPNGALRGAHTLSVWGYVCDESFSSDDPEYYTALIVSDPDDAKYKGRSAPDALVTVQIKWSDVYERYQLTDYSSSLSVWLQEFITLAPRESVDATPNRTTDASVDLLSDAQRRAKEDFFETLEDDEEENS